MGEAEQRQQPDRGKGGAQTGFCQESMDGGGQCGEPDEGQGVLLKVAGHAEGLRSEADHGCRSEDREDGRAGFSTPPTPPEPGNRHGCERWQKRVGSLHGDDDGGLP